MFDASIERCDVFIVGGGLVGSTLALALCQALPDLRVVVCERHEMVPRFNTQQFDPRVVALNHASADLLRGLGIWEGICNTRICAYQDMHVWDGEGNGRIEFGRAAVHREELGWIAENSLILEHLQSALNVQPNLQWLSPQQVASWEQDESGLNWLALNGGEEFTAPLVVAADGAQSDIRTMANIATRHWEYRQSAVVTTIRTEKPHGFVARQRFNQHGPLAFLPLNDPALSSEAVYCSIVWSQTTDVAEELVSLDDEAFCLALSRASEHCLGDVEWSDTRHIIPLAQVHAKQYGIPGLVLVGDAAHRLHPLAGQGVNLGFADVSSLAGEIIRATQRSVPLNHPSILKRYQQERRPKNLAAMAGMEGLKRLFGSDQLVLRLLRNRGMDWLNQMPDVKRWLISMADGS